MAISVRGVGRRYRGVGGGFSVRQGIFGGNVTGSVSLRSRLVSLCRQQHSFQVKECIYGWTAAFEQQWSHIRIRIRLNSDSGIANTTMDTLRTTWADGFRTTWSNRWGCGHAGEMTCPFTFELQWVMSNQHHTVRVRQGSFRSNMTTWDTEDTGGGRICRHHLSQSKPRQHRDGYGRQLRQRAQPADDAVCQQRRLKRRRHLDQDRVEAGCLVRGAGPWCYAQPAAGVPDGATQVRVSGS
jgi:hypothetical protein